MIFLFYISILFAEEQIIQTAQMLYTQQQNQKAHKAVVQCINSVQNKTLYDDCWSFLTSKPNTKHKVKIRSFFKQKCGQFNYSHEQMKLINCSKSQIHNYKIHEYKKNDLALIEN